MPVPKSKSVSLSVANTQEGDRLRSFCRTISKNPYDNDIVDSYFSEIARCLRIEGVCEENLRAGMLLTTALISARLEYPVSIILCSSEEADSINLLEICKKMVPPESYWEVQDIKTENLYSKERYYSHRTLIIRDVNSFKKATPDLMSLLTLGYAERQETYTSKLGGGVKNYRINYPLAFIGIEVPDGPKYPFHPSFIKVDIMKNNHSDRMSEFGNMDPERYKISINCGIVKVVLERLSKSPVSIPYQRQYYERLIRYQTKDLMAKKSVVDKIIRICSILNRPPKWTDEELMQRVVSNKAVPIHNHDMHTSTKADYYFAYLLINNIFPIDKTHYNPEQRKLIDMVKYINYSKLQTATISKMTDTKALLLLHEYPIYWAKLEEIFEEINRGKQIISSYTEVEHQLNILSKGKIISKRKIENKRSYGYFLNVMDINNTISLPYPSEILDTIYGEKKAKVIDPISNNVVEI